STLRCDQKQCHRRYTPVSKRFGSHSLKNVTYSFPRFVSIDVSIWLISEWPFEKTKELRMKIMLEKKRLPNDMLKVKIIGKTNEDVVTNRQFYVKQGTTITELNQLAQLMLQLGAEITIDKITTVDTKAHLFNPNTITN